MIRIIVLTLLFVAGVALSAISVDNHYTRKNKATKMQMKAVIDSKTGCHYLVYSYMGGITPRLTPDGKHICAGMEAASSREYTRSRMTK